MSHCPLRFEDYNSSNKPAVLKCCGKVLCVSCCELDRAEQVEKLKGNRKKIPCSEYVVSDDHVASVI